MKLLLSYINLLLPILNAEDLLKNTEIGLNEVLNFVTKKYFEIHFDGELGVTLAHAFLLKSLTLPIENDKRVNIITFIKKCETIRQKVYPLLPNDPKYMVTFQHKLLNADKWSQSMSDNFTLGKIKDLGYYKNWTVDTITGNKKATYKGIKSDVCLREILEASTPYKYCYISKICWEMMLDPNRVDSGYLLSHRLLYLQVIRLHKCKLPDDVLDKVDYAKVFCTYIYKELNTSEKLGYPYHDIFIEQVVLCGMEGYAEFFKEKWLSKILSWQKLQGCYESIGKGVSKRTSFDIGFGCSDHTTGLGAAALAMHLRFMLWPNIYVE